MLSWATPAGHRPRRVADPRDQARADRDLWKPRERFHVDGILDPEVRPEIARSWMRSREGGVLAHKDLAPVEETFDPEDRILRLSRPILDRLSQELGDADMSLILTDPRGLILERRAGSASLNGGLNEVHLAPGQVYSEEKVGTNGIGTAAEVRSPFWVIGSEHYAEALQWLTCAGVPILNPITHRAEAILDLTCRLDDTNPLMMAVLKQAARDIERRLYEEASERDRELLDHFLAAARRSRRPIVALNPETVIANTAAARLLDPSDHAVLTHQVAQAIGGGGAGSGSLRLSEGRAAEIRFIELEGSESVRAAVLELDVQSPPERVRRSQDAVEALRLRLPGRSAAWQLVLTTVADARDPTVPLLIYGEPGTGKQALARYLHDSGGDDRPFAPLSAELARVGGPARWLGDVRDRLSDTRGSLVLLHLELLDSITHQALVALIAEALRQGAPRIIATACPTSETTATVQARLLSWLPLVVHVPPLRERPEDIADIMPVLLRRHAGGAVPYFSPEALQALIRADWPGNVRQLESVVQGILVRRPTRAITLQDLPAGYQSVPWRRLSPMERAQKQAILDALAQTGGNKARAAGLLGIGRATLYRKLKELGLAEGS
jgi:transcriptional regulator of acetoin/glycerol metabolism